MNSETRQLYSFKNNSWYLWDFATQILLINASVYFSQWLVVDNKVPDFWYSFAFISSTVVLIFLSPYLGVLIDKTATRKEALLGLTILMLVAGVLIQAAAHLPSLGFRIVLALLFYALLNLFYQLAGFVFNTFLKDISTPSNVGKVTGIGGGFSTLGDVFGLVATLPIVAGSVYFFGHSRIDVMVPAAGLALLLCLPMWFAFRKHKDERPDPPPERINAYKSIWKDLKDTTAYPGVTRLLIAFYCYSDAILTLQLFSAIYFDKVYHLSDSQKIPIFVSVYVAFAFGAWIGGYLGDAFGNKKILISGTLFTALTIMQVAFFIKGPIIYVLFSLFGFGTGVSFATTKALFTLLIPYEKKGQFFGLYSISERFANIVGPAVWGIVAYFVTTSGNWNYRAAVIAMSLFLLVGAWVVIKVKDPGSKVAPAA